MRINPAPLKDFAQPVRKPGVDERLGASGLGAVSLLLTIRIPGH
jgi:hypothetical protein